MPRKRVVFPVGNNSTSFFSLNNSCTAYKRQCDDLKRKNKEFADAVTILKREIAIRDRRILNLLRDTFNHNAQKTSDTLKMACQHIHEGVVLMESLVVQRSECLPTMSGDAKAVVTPPHPRRFFTKSMAKGYSLTVSPVVEKEEPKSPNVTPEAATKETLDVLSGTVLDCEDMELTAPVQSEVLVSRVCSPVYQTLDHSDSPKRVIKPVGKENEAINEEIASGDIEKLRTGNVEEDVNCSDEIVLLDVIKNLKQKDMEKKLEGKIFQRTKPKSDSAILPNKNVLEQKDNNKRMSLNNPLKSKTKKSVENKDKLEEKDKVVVCAENDKRLSAKEIKKSAGSKNKKTKLVSDVQEEEEAVVVKRTSKELVNGVEGNLKKGKASLAARKGKNSADKLSNADNNREQEEDVMRKSERVKVNLDKKIKQERLSDDTFCEDFDPSISDLDVSEYVPPNKRGAVKKVVKRKPKRNLAAAKYDPKDVFDISADLSQSIGPYVSVKKLKIVEDCSKETEAVSATQRRPTRGPAKCYTEPPLGKKMRKE